VDAYSLDLYTNNLSLLSLNSFPPPSPFSSAIPFSCFQKTDINVLQEQSYLHISQASSFSPPFFFFFFLAFTCIMIHDMTWEFNSAFLIWFLCCDDVYKPVIFVRWWWWISGSSLFICLYVCCSVCLYEPDVILFCWRPSEIPIIMIKMISSSSIRLHASDHQFCLFISLF
jgi:hypothetical protein